MVLEIEETRIESSEGQHSNPSNPLTREGIIQIGIKGPFWKSFYVLEMEHFDKKQRLQNAWRLAFMGILSLNSGFTSTREEFSVDLK